MGTLLIKNATVITKDTLLKNHQVYCVDGKINRILPNSENVMADQIVDAEGKYLAPGFIDLHIHGTKNLLVEQGREDLEQLCEVLPRYGVTGFLPTICPMDCEENDIKLFDSLSQTQSKGTNILGFFLEGHYLELTGAISHLPKDLRPERVERIIKTLEPYIPVFGISPEVEGILELLPYMTSKGYPAFITHTGATAEQTESAIEAGAVHATHLYNVFPYMGKKELGVRGCGALEAVLANPKTSVDMILDGEHVHPVSAKIALACKGKDKVCLITDANMNAGMPPGRYIGLSNTEIDVAYEGGPARMSENSKLPGALAGSGLTMDKAVRNAVGLLGLELPQAIAMASVNPARVLGLHNHKGLIEQEYDADLILLDENLNVTKCWVGGNCCFNALS